ncbi:hypothetical protein A1O7_04309 [Cladophialophora yegresii CBS 114405]|uniref:Major facilitator superfamily (MFS) profile domain-containing protein n=1 Tax=Cladophialophora yegresii CBS 114405 TaxID=1182544 RepID=W9VWE5_9EURO|nr:uncharacterized protein A1O7_04309 [Cladophialophora yegresii CBS 114405]EXJ60157.1 hypothetical protein A1O7_04309 [Cladophialophora yegresii CBS 114405]
MVFPGSWITRCVNGRLAFASAIMMLSQINFGMDLVAFSNTQAMNAFNKKFGAYDEKLERYAIDPSFLSLLNSLTYVGQAFGVVTGGWIGRHYGRRASFWVMSCWATLSAILLVTAQKKEQVLVGRILNYVYLGQELVTVPVFQAEIAPPQIRGIIVGTFQLGTMVGAFIMACITYGTSKLDGEQSFRIPFGIFFIIPCIVAVGAWFMRESPRWLLLRHREAEAQESLRLYRKGKFTEEQIMEEYHEQVAMIAVLTQDKGTFKEMWQGTNRKRSLIVIGANISIQISGQGLFSKYGTIFLKDLHGPDPFQMFLINTALQIVVVLCAMYMFDRFGRRPNLIIGSAIQSASYFAIGGLGTRSDPGKGTKIGITALFTVFYLAFVFGWAPIYHILTSEIPSSRMRDVTYTVASFITVVSQFVVSFCIPYLLYAPYANLGSKIGFVFAPIAFCTLMFAIFGVPECRGFSLEEIDHLFRQKIPVRHFSRYKHGQILPEEATEQIAQKMGEGPSVELKEVVGA